LGHASITVTAHIYADLYDDEFDDVASALDDTGRDLPSSSAGSDPQFWPDIGRMHFASEPADRHFMS
jgi:hypothetical protein